MFHAKVDAQRVSRKRGIGSSVRDHPCALNKTIRAWAGLSAGLSYSGTFRLCSNEQTSDAPPKVKESSGDSRADPLEDKEPGAGIDISVSLAFECEAERDK
jgi:hypothetical protein